MKRKVMAIVLGCALVGGLGLLHAANSEEGFCFTGHFGKGRLIKAVLHRIADELELTALQREGIHELMKRKKRQVKGRIMRLKANDVTIFKLIEGGSVSDEAVKEHVARQSAIVAELMEIRIRAIEEGFSLLDEGQKRKVVALHQRKGKHLENFLNEG